MCGLWVAELEQRTLTGIPSPFIGPTAYLRCMHQDFRVPKTLMQIRMRVFRLLAGKDGMCHCTDRPIRHANRARSHTRGTHTRFRSGKGMLACSHTLALSLPLRLCLSLSLCLAPSFLFSLPSTPTPRSRSDVLGFNPHSFDPPSSSIGRWSKSFALFFKGVEDLTC